MRKFLLLLCLSALPFIGIKSQSWSATLNAVDGLPGISFTYYGEEYYTFSSELFTPGGTLDLIRITVTETIEGEKPNGNNVTFALSGLTVYDKDGNTVPYTAFSNADHNSLAPNSDGDGLPALSDNDLKSYFHSMWSYNQPVTEYHYIDLMLTKSVSSFRLEWTTRVGESKNAPITVGITLGTQYTPENNSTEMSLGNQVTGDNELAESEQLFVLKGNAVKFFNAANGTTYMGSGPIFMQCAETGDTEVNSSHIMQLIPVDDGKYLIYWPAASKFLKDSGNDYNGLNGWQYSTYNINEAAHAEIKATGDGHFEISYNSTYNNQPITLYTGAEMRDGVISKMKIFTPEHKQYLEDGDYTHGYALPIAFNWSIYKANIDKSKVNTLSIQTIAELLLDNTINKATSYLGSFDEYCNNNENLLLESKIIEARELSTAANITFNEINRTKEELTEALLNYIATKLDFYVEQVNTLYSEAQFSSFPNYIKDTYPESSRSMLEGLYATVANAQNQTYTIEEYEALYNQIERDIELFESTKITETTTPEEDDEDIPVEEDLIYVYLSNGDIDIYELSAIEGEYYTEGDRLYIPLKGGDIMYYTKEEYDSCSTVKPALPTMTSYKFNNKYNPNLHIDAIAENVTNNITFNLNSIGKWLTASFNLSDDKAVAYVDTVLQISKETRRSFKDAVTYNVTYPGYNIVKNIKTQDEIWSDPVVGTQVTDVALTSDMLYTNKPSTQSNESLANLLDNNANTIFHSTWGDANNATINVKTYITIDLPEALENIQIYYRCRPQAGYNPLVWDIYASNDGDDWKLVRTLDYTTDYMPTGGRGQEFTSSTIDLQGSYSKLKIEQTRGEYSKNHLAIAELRIKKVVEETSGEPVKIQDAKYETKRVPYGNKYKVKVNWLTDTPNVPRIDIDVDGGYFINSKDYYRNANFRITGFGIYENFEDSVQIKGRGNTSWGYDKKPYRLKFAEKVKPFGLTKGKSWVLLANAQKGSLMANAISMKIGQMAGTEYANHIVPVELYMNGQYMGSYMFTEHIGLSNNSVDVDEDFGYLLELDEYYDEDYKFKTTYYSLPVNVKDPDLSEYIASRELKIKNQMNAFCEAVAKGEEVTDMLDMDAFARFMLANDLSLNQEIGHPKSTFLFKENEDDENSKFKFGPIWDFDWGFGYESGGNKYCYSQAQTNILKTSFAAYSFFRDLMMLDSFKKNYYKVWWEFLNNNSMDELMDFIDCYYNFAQSSFSNNAFMWGSSCDFSEADKERHKSWIQERKDYIYDNLQEYDISDLIYIMLGDVNCNNQVTIHDAALITAHLNGNTHASFNTVKGDCDKNGEIELADARIAETQVKENEVPLPTYWYSTPQAIGEFYAEEISIELGDVQDASLNMLAYNEEQYKALQFDVTLPEGIELIDIMGGAVSGHNFSYTDKGNNVYRITAYSDDDECFSANEESIIEMILTSTDIINEDNCMIRISNAYTVDKDNNELRIKDYNIKFSQETGIKHNFAEALIEGGKCITITLLEPQEIAIYSVDGRKVRNVNAKKGTTRVTIPAGIYIVNGEKVIVK